MKTFTIEVTHVTAYGVQASDPIAALEQVKQHAAGAESVVVYDEDGLPVSETYS